MESLDPQFSPKSVRSDLARAPGALIRLITVYPKNRLGLCMNLKVVDILWVVESSLFADHEEEVFFKVPERGG